MSKHVEECCNLLQVGLDCTYSDPYYMKEIYGSNFYKGPAITACLLTVLFILLAVLVIRNLIVLCRKRTLENIRDQFIVNTLTAIPVFLRLVFWLDGPLQLVSNERTSFSPSLVTSLQVISNCFLNMTLAYSSYAWLRLILQSKNKWETTRSPLIINGAFFCNAIFLLVIMALTIAFAISNLEAGFLVPLIPLSVATFLNSIVFAVSCYWMGCNLTQIYDFDSPKRKMICYLKALAIGVALFSTVRVFIGISSYIFAFWQQKMNLQSYCNQDLSWSIYIFLVSIVVDFAPLGLCLIVFAPEAKQKGQNQIEYLQDLLVDSSSENEEEKDTKRLKIAMKGAPSQKTNWGSF